MVTVTIDTNSINYLRRDRHLNQLEAWHRAGLIEITRTSVMVEELVANLGPKGKARLKKATGYQEGAPGFTIGVSRLGGPDVLGGPASHGLAPVIENALFPNVPFDKLIERQRRDALHLAIHKGYGWDYFVTKDKGILCRQQELEDEFDIHALSPEEAVGVIGRALKEAGSAQRPLKRRVQ